MTDHKRQQKSGSPAEGKIKAMCKATKKADVYNIQKDKKTGAFNISFNGVYSNDVRNLMYKSGFRWSKSNNCFYGWTKDIQSLSIEIQKLVYEWRNLKNKAGSIEVPVIFEKDIETVEIYQNKKDYVMACKASNEAVIKVSSLDDIIDELPFDPAPEVIESLTSEKVTEAITGQNKEEIINKEENTKTYLVTMTDTSLKDEKELGIAGLRVTYEFDAIDEKDAKKQARAFDPGKRIVSVTEKNPEPKTLESLLEKYGCGVTVDEDGRFYNGNNNNEARWQEILNKYDPKRQHPRHSSLGKYIKDVIKNELGLVVSARFKWATHTPELNITLKGNRCDMFKSWDELTAEEKHEFMYRTVQNSFHWIWYGVSSLPKTEEYEPIAKKYYETFTMREDFLKDNYKLAHSFAKALMDSFQYDHTGAFMGDCDYIDCDYFDFVYLEVTDRMDVDESNKIYHEIEDWMINQSKICKEYDRIQHEAWMKRQGAAA